MKKYNTNKSTGHPFGLRETVNSCIMDINTEIQT